jgi:hypothetical protein
MDDPDQPDRRPDHGPRDFAAFAGWYAIGASALFALCVLVGDMIVPGNDMMADTISAMAAGRMSWIVDTGIIAYASALAMLGLGAAAAHPGGWRWSGGMAGLVLLAMTVFLIGFRNEYGDGDRERGETYHVIFVYILGALLVLVPLALADGAGRFGRGYRRALLAVALVWALTAPWFFFMPTGYDGLYERALGVVSFAFVGTLALMLIRAGRGQGSRDAEGLPSVAARV